MAPQRTGDLTLSTEPPQTKRLCIKLGLLVIIADADLVGVVVVVVALVAAERWLYSSQVTHDAG